MSIEIDVRPREAGKTHALIQWFLRNPEDHVIIAANEWRAADIRSAIRDDFVAKYGEAQAEVLLRELFLNHRVISMHTVPTGLRGRTTKKIRIDQADDILQGLVGPHHLEGVTWNA